MKVKRGAKSDFVVAMLVIIIILIQVMKDFESQILNSNH